MRIDKKNGAHYADCMFCGTEWIVSSCVKEPYTCPYCRANFRSATSKQKGEKNGKHKFSAASAARKN